MRKILSLVLVLSLVLGSMSFAFAAPSFSDVDNEDVLDAVKRLNAFGIVDGYEDGTYKPENSITRAEFAKLLVTALGLDNAAQAASTTRFTDANGAWYTGYVEVAAGQGLVNGYPDGTFKPNQTVSYSEAVTMLVRSLGYKDEWLSGTWPGNFIAKAAELDITDDVSFTPSGLANRGDVAILVDNTLDAETIKQASYGDDNNYEESGNTLLAEKLEIVKLDDPIRFVEVPKVNEDLDSDEVEADDSETYTIVQEDVDVNSLLGMKADVYLNDDDEIVYIELDDEEVVFDEVAADATTDEVELVIEDDTFDIDEDAIIYVNGEKVSDGDDVDEGMYGKVVFNDDDEVIFMDLYDFDVKGMLVTEVDVDAEEIEYYPIGETDTDELDLTDADDGYKFLLDNKEIELDDIEKDDVLYKAEVTDNGDDIWAIIVVRDSVEEELDKIDDGDLDLGDDYALVENETSFSLDDDDELTVYADEDNVADMEDMVGEEVTAILDITGDVRHVRADVDATSGTIYGVIEKTWTSEDDMIKIFNEDGEDVSYEYDSDDITGATTEDFLIEYEVDSDGVIDSATTYSIDDAKEDVDSFDEDADSITIAGTEYFVTSGTVLFNLDDDNDPELVEWEDINDKTPTGVEVVFIAGDNNDLDAVLFVTGFESIASDIEVGTVLDRYYDGDWKAEVSVYDGEKAVYELEDKDDLAEGDLVEFKITTGGELQVLDSVVESDLTVDATGVTTLFSDDDQNKAVYAKVYDRDDKLVTVYNPAGDDEGTTYRINDDTLIYEYVFDEDNDYDEIKSGSLSDIKDDSSVVIVVEMDGSSAKSYVKVIYVVTRDN